MAKKDSFEKWAASLTAEQMMSVLVELAEFAEEAEMSLRAALYDTLYRCVMCGKNQKADG